MTKKQEFLRRVDAAIADFIGGASQAEVKEKHGISKATLRRHMRKRGLRLSPEELRVRRRQAGQTTQDRHRRRVIRTEPCPRDCTCGKHKPNENALKNPVVVGRKNCGKCGRWRSHLDFYARERYADGTPVLLQSTCKVCMAETTRVNQGIRRRGKPYGVRRPGMTPEQRREHKRKLHRWKMENLPGYAEDRREYARIYAEGKRREAGIAPRNFKNRSGRCNPKGEPKLPLEPFQQWIKERARFYAMREGLYEITSANEVAGISYLASVCGVAERTLRRYLDGYENTKKGERKAIEGVPFSTLDQCLTYEGSSFLWDLYPTVDEEQLLAA